MGFGSFRLSPMWSLCIPVVSDGTCVVPVIPGITGGTWVYRWFPVVPGVSGSTRCFRWYVCLPMFSGDAMPVSVGVVK